MSEEINEDGFIASPQTAEKIVRALRAADGDDVSGFQFGALKPVIELDASPLRPKDGGGRLGPIEGVATAWRLET